MKKDKVIMNKYMEKNNKVYEVLKNWIYDKGTSLNKKHGNWILLYLREKQVCFMDTWNGHIYQAHDNGNSVIDDGYIDCQFSGRIHTVITKQRYPRDSFKLFEAIDLYKLMLKSS